MRSPFLYICDIVYRVHMRKALLLLALTLGCASLSQAQQSTERSSSRVTIAGQSFYVHTVQAGETFYSLSKLYDTDEKTIRAYNPIVIDGLKRGQMLKIPVNLSGQKELSARKMNKLFDTHIVNKGETAYSISKRYGISLATLMEDNPGFDPAHLSIGQKINVRIKSQGESQDADIDQEIGEYSQTLNAISPRFTHHVVAKGETLYTLSKLTGIPADTIFKYNATVLQDGLKYGSILKLPISASEVETALSTAGGISTTTPAPVDDDMEAPTNGYPANESPAVVPLTPLTPALSGPVQVKHIDMTAPIKVAVLLPVRVGGTSDRRYLEFYQGVLLALDELKATGVSTQVDLFNTARSVTEVQKLLNESAMKQADLIIGPVYEDCFMPVADFAAKNGIPVVSPLASMKTPGLPLMFEVSPSDAFKYTKLQEEFSPSNNIVVVSATSNNDPEMLNEIVPLLPTSARKVTYVKGSGGNAAEKWIDLDKTNVFVVLSQNEQMTEEILASISSVQNTRISRGQTCPPIKVVGSSRWPRFQNIDKNLFFKLNLRYTTNYHADRGNERVADFDRRYVAAFSSLPSMYSYRGYDVAKLFVGAIKLHGNEFVSYVNERELPLLQTPYRFGQVSPDGKFANNEWAKVCYNSNYTIDVQ